MNADLPHIIISNEKENLSYTSPNRRGSEPKIPVRNQQQHGRFIYKKLNDLWKTEKETTAVGMPILDNIVLEFKSAPEYDLVTKSLEDLRQGIRLLNIREEKNSNDEIIIKAVVSIPKNKIDVFFKKIEKYLEIPEDNKKPKNQKLINSIDDINKAVLKSFWCDKSSLMPETELDWCEVWLKSENEETLLLDNFFKICKKLKIEYRENEFLTFPERKIVLIKANKLLLGNLLRYSSDIAEFRLSKSPARFWIDLDNKEKREWGKDLLSRLQINASSLISVAVIDTGVNNGHDLLNPVISDDECMTIKSDGNSNDTDGHGTLMCGLVTYGDLQKCLEQSTSVKIMHHIESVKILNTSGTENSKHLYGYFTEKATYLPEINFPERKRILCIAVTSEDCSDGKPSSWSATIDKLAFGDDSESITSRLFIISTGNIVQEEVWKEYPYINMTTPIQEPAQSWNAITVGAYTEKDTISEEIFKDYKPLAPKGGLSPYSRTSSSWDKKWPIKPEVVFEGGNLAKNETNIDSPTDLSILSTSKDVLTKYFDVINATSSATAKASWFAAQILSIHPEYTPETIRGLIVHSAEWNDTLVDQFWDNSKTQKDNYKNLLKICGYGIPNLRKALYSASNSLTLIAEESIQPYQRIASSQPKSKDMHIIELPWKQEDLLSLPSDTMLKLKVTLSYFIEPAPGELSWKDRYRYQSHALRFALNLPGDSKEVFIKKLNTASRAEDENIPSSTDDRWGLGVKNRNVGSIHSDFIEKISAADLATTKYIGIYPITGWWKERKNLNKYSNSANYSLIVSIETPDNMIDLYTPISIALKQQIKTN